MVTICLLTHCSLLMLVCCLQLQGSKLTELINSQHENPKYLPGISLGDNTVADPDLESTVSAASCDDMRIYGHTLTTV
jgi:glycerol-3-phosphate dehydrogenase